MNTPFTERPAFVWLVGGTYLALCAYFAYGFLALKEAASIYYFWLFWLMLFLQVNRPTATNYQLYASRLTSLGLALLTASKILAGFMHPLFYLLAAGLLIHACLPNSLYRRSILNRKEKEHE